MKIKDGFVLKEVAGSFVVMKLGGENTLGGMITLNETGALIWNGIAQGKAEDEIAKSICAEYEIDEETALKDIKAFIAKMAEADVLED